MLGLCWGGARWALVLSFFCRRPVPLAACRFSSQEPGPAGEPCLSPCSHHGKQTNRCVGMKGEGHSPGPGRHTDLSAQLCLAGLLAPQREAGTMVSGGPVMCPSLAQQVEAAGGPSWCLRGWGVVEDVPCVRATSGPALTQEPQPCDPPCPGTPVLPVLLPLNQI